jgi:ubiquinone/menaquinone biosynthesis C-methylase UbiE
MAKDLFSEQASAYALYRPGYPRELFEYILSFVSSTSRAWDCATGNGQAAQSLALLFDHVDATDISEAQLKKAIPASNIHYHLCPAEKTPFPDDSFDLITVATAYHWLNWDAFHKEARRVAKSNGIIAIWAYDIFHSDDPLLTKLVEHFYRDITGPYWDPERKYVDEHYTTVKFEFDELPARDFEQTLNWTREQVKGYLSSWSAVQHYIDKNGTSPLIIIEEELNKIWEEGEVKSVRFPLFLRIGRIAK